MDAATAALRGAVLGGAATLVAAVFVSRWQRKENRIARKHTDAHDGIVAFINAAQGAEQAAIYRFEHGGASRHPELEARIHAMWATQNVLATVASRAKTRDTSRLYAISIHEANFAPLKRLHGSTPWDIAAEPRSHFFAAARSELGTSSP